MMLILSFLWLAFVDSVNLSSDKQKAWWLDGKIKLKLCQIYRAKGMLEDFVNTIFPLVRESLYVKTLRQKVIVPCIILVAYTSGCLVHPSLQNYQMNIP